MALLTSPHNASWPPALLQNCAIDTLKHELRKSILVLKCRPQQTQFHCSEQEAGELLTCTRARHGIQQNPSAENAVGARNRHAYFQARHGNRVTLYTDAIADPERLPPIKLGHGFSFRTESAWDDMFAHICDAKHFIYITGVQSCVMSLL